MTTITSNAAPQAAPDSAPFSWFAILDILFAVKLREKLDADTGGDKSDASYRYGL